MASRVLIARGVDGLCVGWLAVIVWLGVYVADKIGVSWTFPGLMVVFWIGAAVTAAHFALSYHLAYRRGTAALRERPFVLVVAPAVLALTLAGVVAVTLHSGKESTRVVTSALITVVYLMTTWHYIKQVYGVGRVGAAYAGVSLDSWDVRVLRFCLYPLAVYGAARTLEAGTRYYIAGYQYGLPILPAGTANVLRALALCAAVPIVVVFVRIARRTGRMPPSLLVAPYLATYLWLGLPTSLLLTALLLAPFHGLQYLAIGHRAELAVTPTTRHSLAWWLNIFAGCAAGGLLVSRWVPQWLDEHVQAPGGGSLLFAACVFVFLNLHHYLIDATIWRSTGELVKAMVRKPAPTTPAPELVPAG